MIEAVLFDMDGVIVDSMSHHVETWKRAFLDKGFRIDDIDIYRREGMSGIASVREILFEKGEKDVSDAEIEELMSIKHEYFENITIEVYPDVHRLLDFLYDKQIRMALVTGSGRRSVNHLLNEDLRAMFTAIVTSDDTVKGKPCPEPYLKALELLHVNAESALVVENAPLGIESAKNADLMCLAIQTTLTGYHLEKADRVFLSHLELENYFCSVFKEKEKYAVKCNR